MKARFLMVLELLSTSIGFLVFGLKVPFKVRTGFGSFAAAWLQPLVCRCYDIRSIHSQISQCSTD